MNGNAAGREPTKEVMEMDEIHFDGNIIPQTWYQHLKHEKGLVNLTAIVILAEICYWYRPRKVEDEETGELIRKERKFKGDKLQRNYQSFENIGLTKKQAYDACHFLAKKGLITLETRTIETKQKVKITNVLFIGIRPAEIKKLNTWVDKSALPGSNAPLLQSNAVPKKRKSALLPSNHPLLPSNTYTEITTEITSKDVIPTTTGENPPEPVVVVKKIPLSKFPERICCDYARHRQSLDKRIKSFEALGRSYFLSGEKDYLIQEWLDEQNQPPETPPPEEIIYEQSNPEDLTAEPLDADGLRTELKKLRDFRKTQTVEQISVWAAPLYTPENWQWLMENLE